MLFFFKQKTAYEMRISDWSSDVCSSDLPEAPYGNTDGNQDQKGDGETLSHASPCPARASAIAATFSRRTARIAASSRGPTALQPICRSIAARAVRNTTNRPTSVRNREGGV